VSELTRPVVERLCAEYERQEPFFTIEHERLETMPTAIREGSYGWKDVEWMVRWYYRRHLSSRYNARRKQVEEGFRSNEWDEVRDTLQAVVGLDDPVKRNARLATLEGIDVPVATGIQYFITPDEDMVMGEIEWSALEANDHIDQAYPPSPTSTTYARYLTACSHLCDDIGISFIQLQRALWRFASVSR